MEIIPDSKYEKGFTVRLLKCTFMYMDPKLPISGPNTRMAVDMVIKAVVIKKNENYLFITSELFS